MSFIFKQQVGLRHPHNEKPIREYLESTDEALANLLRRLREQRGGLRLSETDAETVRASKFSGDDIRNLASAVTITTGLVPEMLIC